MKTEAGQLRDGDLRHGENVLKNPGMNFSSRRAHTNTPRAYHRFERVLLPKTDFFLFP